MDEETVKTSEKRIKAPKVDHRDFYLKLLFQRRKEVSPEAQKQALREEQQKTAVEINKLSKEISSVLTGEKKEINAASLKAAWAIHKGVISKDDLVGFTKPEEVVTAVDNAKAQKRAKAKETVRR